jgi:uncharacterized membrane protein YjfL (UPF0719 family)
MEHGTRYVALFGAGTILTMLVVLRVIQRVRARSLPADQVDNAARRLLAVGEVLATFLVGAAVVHHNVRGEDLRADLAWTAAFAALGLAMVQVVGGLSLRMLLRARLPEELASGNVAAGLAAASHLVATGILASHAVAGHSLYALGLAMAFFALALVAHGLFVALFRALTTYDDAEQIEGENLAAGLSYAGVTVAVAVLVARGLEGDFAGWWVSLRGFAGVAAWCLALYPVRQIVVEGLLLGARPSLRGGALDKAIGTDRNEGMAALEATAYLGAALAIARLA